MKTLVMFALVLSFGAAALAETPDLSALPDHPRLYIGGHKDAAGYIDPDTLPERAKSHPEQFALLESSTTLHARALSAVIKGDKDKLAEVVKDLKSYRVRRGEDLAQAAIAFDWVAPSLSQEDIGIIAKSLGDMAEEHAKLLGRRFNPFDNNPLRRDMGVATTALAIAGHDPRAQELFNTAHSIFEEFMVLTGDGASPDDMLGRGMYGGGWPEGHDYDRHGSRYAIIYFLGLRSATGMDVFTGSDYWQAKPFFHIYTLLPNGKNVLPFQDDDHPFLIRHDREVMLVLAKEFQNPYAQYYVNHINLLKDSTGAVFEFLFDEPDSPEKDFTDLPKAHYIPGTGMVYARSGWGENDTYVAFCASDWYVYHQNNAQNVFAIYRNAPLAIKDGVYDGSVHGHYVNYSIRSIAYNGITVFDPDESYGGPDGIKVADNDGGQMIHQWKGNPQTLKMWREQARRTDRPMRDIVDWKGFETTDTYTYAAAEAGRAYRPGKVPFFSRQLVFIYPSWVLVFDRVTSGNPSFAKKFHLHAPEEMEVSGKSAVITTKEFSGTTIPGRLFVKSLLPKDGKVERVDGVATYGGKTWIDDEAYNDQAHCEHHLNVTAPEEETSYFLHAMYACDADVEDAPAAEITEETADSVTVSIDGGKHTVRFNKTGDIDWEMVK